MTCEYILHGIALEQLQVSAASLERDVEILSRLIRLLEEKRDVLEDRHAIHSIALYLFELGFQPILLLRGFLGCTIGMLDQAGIEHDAGEIGVAEGVVVGSESFAVRSQGLRGRFISNIVIPGDAVKRNGS